MPNGLIPNSHSAVSRVELTENDSINLAIDVYGFDKGTQIELSGQVIQDNGAVATFYSVQEMPANADKEATLPVASISAVPPNKFVAGFPITVVARAAEVWITKLDNDTGDNALLPRVLRGSSSPLKGAWKETSYGSAVGSAEQEASYAVPQSSEPSTSGSLLRHGTWWDRRKGDRLDVVMGGRFTRLFPYLPAARFDQKDLEALAGAMIAPPEGPEPEGRDDPEENKGIPAAYTYLGQFTDHDLTFDPISHLRETLTRARLRALVDFRTPRFDLDNLYGRGPATSPTCTRKTGSACSWASGCRKLPSTRARSSYPGGRAAGRSSATPATTKTASSRNCMRSFCGSTTGSSISYARQQARQLPGCPRSGPMALPVGPGQGLPARNPGPADIREHLPGSLQFRHDDTQAPGG